MDIRSGMIYEVQEIPPKTPEQYIKEVDFNSLSPKTRKMLNDAGKAQISKNSKCPCGSGRKFKRCCMSK